LSTNSFACASDDFSDEALSSITNRQGMKPSLADDGASATNPCPNSKDRQTADKAMKSVRRHCRRARKPTGVVAVSEEGDEGRNESTKPPARAARNKAQKQTPPANGACNKATKQHQPPTHAASNKTKKQQPTPANKRNKGKNQQPPSNKANEAADKLYEKNPVALKVVK
jgi:hypothetical protein